MLNKGIYTALVTPFTKENTLDITAFHTLLTIQSKASITGVVIGGTTGESATITQEELITLIDESAPYNMPVIVGIGSANTAYSAQLAKNITHNKHVSALLLVMPYYNKPTQQGMIAHVEAVLKNSNVPIILYNVPSRTGVTIQPETVAKLYEQFPQHIIGIKEATQDMLTFTRLRRLCGNDFLILTGDDATLYPSLTVGSSGSISVISNVMPKTCMELFHAFETQNYIHAQNLHERMQEYIHCLFLESNPIPVKYVLSYLGIIKEYMRLPLTPLSPIYRERIESCIAHSVEDIRIR